MADAMPARSAQAAIVLGFLLGTWMLVDGLHCIIAGDFLRWHGALGPWAALVARAGVDPMRMGAVIALFGAAWMVTGNLYLFQNRRANWQAMVVLVVLSSWYVGLATPILIAQLILLLMTPGTLAGQR